MIFLTNILASIFTVKKKDPYQKNDMDLNALLQKTIQDEMECANPDYFRSGAF